MEQCMVRNLRHDWSLNFKKNYQCLINFKSLFLFKCNHLFPMIFLIILIQRLRYFLYISMALGKKGQSAVEVNILIL